MKAERNILKFAHEIHQQRRAEYLEAERARMSRVAAAARRVDGAALPADCGDGIIPAPARGASVVVQHVTMVPNGTDARGEQKWAAAASGYGHRASIREADVFDRMLRSSIAADRPAPLTPGQIAIARRYRALVERHDAGGIRCTDLVGVAGGGTGRDFMDAYLAEGSEIAAMRRRIGSGSALVVRRIRPSARGSRRAILDRSLVDLVCLGDRTLSDVLRAHGWQVDGRHRAALSEALCGALDRMIGYRGEKTS